MQGNSISAANHLHLGLGLSRHHHPFVARGGFGALHHVEPFVHVLLEMLRIIKAGNTVGGQVVPEIRTSRHRAVTEPSQHSGQYVHHAGKAIAFVGAQLPGGPQGQHVVLLGHGRQLFHDWRPVLSGQPARLQRGPQTSGDFNLVLGHRAGGRVENEGVVVFGRYRDGDGIGAQAGFSTEGGQRSGRTTGHTDADHIVLQRQHGVIRSHAQVPGVAQRHHAHANVLGFANGQLHGLGSGYHAQPSV